MSSVVIRKVLSLVFTQESWMVRVNMGFFDHFWQGERGDGELPTGF